MIYACIVNPLTRYHSLIEQGLLKDDPHQSKIIGILQEMHDQLKGYSPKVIPEGREDGGGIVSSPIQLIPSISFFLGWFHIRENIGSLYS